MVRVVFQGVRHECRACDGVLEGLVPFQDQVQPTEARHIWRDSEEGPAVGACPFCGGELRAPKDGDAAGIAVCRLCEQVWVPKSAEPWMRVHAAARANQASHVPPVPEDCTNCGAPYSPDERGLCRFCHAQLSAPTHVVVVEL
jgi:hypothetical protein